MYTYELEYVMFGKWKCVAKSNNWDDIKTYLVTALGALLSLVTVEDRGHFIYYTVSNVDMFRVRCTHGLLN